MAKFAQDTPPYLIKNQDVRVRQPNPVLVQDALECARRRFEEQLLREREREARIEQEMRRYQDESQIYYNEIELQKLLQREQTNQVLKLQIEQSNKSKVPEVQLNHPAVTFGPVETEEIHQYLKEKQLKDKHEQRRILMEQMRD
jgi:hypothetical protein